MRELKHVMLIFSVLSGGQPRDYHIPLEFAIRELEFSELESSQREADTSPDSPRRAASVTQLLEQAERMGQESLLSATSESDGHPPQNFV